MREARTAGRALRLRARQGAARARRARALHRSPGLRSWRVDRAARRLPRRGRPPRRDAASDRGITRQVVRGRADRGAALGARQHLDAALRRPFVGVRLGMDAHPRRAPSPRLRPRVRVVRSRRLGRARATPSPRRRRERVFVTHGYTDALARFLDRPRPRGARRGARSTKASPRGRRNDGMKRFADLYDEIDRTTSTNAKVAALVTLSPRRPAGRRGLGALLPHRPPAEAPCADAVAARWTLELTGLPEWLVEESYSHRRRFCRNHRAPARRPRRAVRSGIRVSRLADRGMRRASAVRPARADRHARRGRHAGRMDRGAHPAAPRHG